MDVFDLINTKIGTKNLSRFSNGNIYPIVSMPFGMVNFSIQTDESRWFYDPYSNAFEGIRLTRQPSPWMGDYAHLLFLPFTGEIRPEKDRRWTSYKPEEAIIKPYLMEAYLQRYRLSFKLTTTERCAFLSVDSKYNDNVGLAIMPYEGMDFKVLGNVIFGSITTSTCYGEKTVTEYFYIECSSPISNYSVGKETIVYFNSRSVDMKIAVSFISVEQAKENFSREIKTLSFEEVMENNKNEWLSYLTRIEVSNENIERSKTFYSCFYRALLFPRKFYEYDPEGNIVHFNVDTGKVENGVFYTDNGFWDTYRTVYPFLQIIKPDLVKEMIEGFVNFAEETGALPRWICPGEHGLMPGTLVEATLSDACIHGIVDKELLDRCYKVLLRSADTVYDSKYQGRIGLSYYKKYGYVPNTIKESINNTCDCAYGDYCIAQVAKLVGDTENYIRLTNRSKNYRNLFDKNTGFLRGKDLTGNFKFDFDPFEWGGENCEGSSWQNSFAVYHDLVGLAELYGGVKEFEEKIDELFSTPPLFTVGAYTHEIHEMSEMACVNFGQCAISNQPSFHIPFIYTIIGKREKTEYWVEKLVNEAFNSSETGLPGDEDNGTMACWYMFACLGFYPMCPGSGEFVSSKPLFEKIKINGKPISKQMKDIVILRDILI